MPYELKGRTVLITGGGRGLGVYIAHKFAAAGCNICINYVADATAAEKVCGELMAQHKVQALSLQADVGVQAECIKLVQQTVQHFNGLDILIYNAGWTKIAPFPDLSALSEEEWDKCWAVNVKGPLWTLREAMPTFNTNDDGGVFIMTSSIAGLRPTGSSMAYSVSKAAGIHLMRCLASSQGAKLRANAVLPGLLLTDWGLQFPPEKIEAVRNAAALKKVTDLEDCADAFLMIARNSSMTGQKVQVDAGVII